jgi:hypothetical protein
MKNIPLAIIAIFFCFPLFAQNPAANQVQINKRNFTIGTNTYDADYNLIFNQWYKGHKNAEEAKPGEDLSWINDFTRTYTLGFEKGNLTIGGNAIGDVKIIWFGRSGGRRNSFGDIGILTIRQWLVYDSNNGKLIGAQLDINAYNAYFNVRLETFDMPEFVFPLKANTKNTAVSNINASSGFVSYKVVYEWESNAGSTSAGKNESIYLLNSDIAKKLKDADDYAKTVKRDIPSLMGELSNVSSYKATHRLTLDLNVFSQQDGGSAVVANLKKGDPVNVLEYGQYASWNGITAKWAKVQTNDNKTGWLFSGYLEEVNK